jgi:hypothetical protein
LRIRSEETTLVLAEAVRSIRTVMVLE